MSGLILVVEDETDLVETLDYNLQREGFQTRLALTGKDGLALARQSPAPDLILLDLMLPDVSGTEVCRQLRADPTTQGIPVIMVTARSEEIDRVVGFEVGADDYVTKPYSVRELVLRVRAVLKRARPDAAPPSETQFGRLRIDEPGHRVWLDGDEISLTALEFKLLSTFLSRKGRVQTRDRLLTDVWGYDANVTTRTVDTHVKRLRSKLGEAGVYIETLRGVGYRFRSNPDRPTAD
jgi:two-component system phosphate regulon response regulator PhoB